MYNSAHSQSIFKSKKSPEETIPLLFQWRKKESDEAILINKNLHPPGNAFSTVVVATTVLQVTL